MEEAVKKESYVRPGVGRAVDEQRHGEADTTPAPTPEKPPAGDRQHDRWFLEQRGGRRVAKRLNIVNDMQVTPRGPLKLTGNITLIDSDGQESFHNELTLCRCGASQSKPLCDNQHVEIEFFDNGAINQASQIARSNTPQPLLVTVIENGPLLFRGYLRVHNPRGQECVSRKGALCRCGKSSKKPFCDCYRA
jgi:CDGSH-type Zn-finger protein